MGFNATSFRNKVQDVARPQYFLISFPNVINDSSGDDEIGTLSIMASSTSLPARSVDPIEIPIQGLPMKIGGNPSFDNWTVTFKALGSHMIRNAFLKWNSQVVDASNMSRSLPEEYKEDNIWVAQLNDENTIVSAVKFYGMWPTNVGEITLGHEEEAPEEYDVEFAYDFWQFGSPDGVSWDIGADINIQSNGLMEGSDLDTNVDISLGAGISV